MVDASVRRSPQFYARTAGLLYLYIIAAGTFAEVFVRGRLVRTGDAALTAQNILGNESLFRIGASAELLHLVSDVVVSTFLYLLLRAVHRPAALLTLFLRFACIVILAMASVTQFAALRLMRGADALSAVAAEERNALALLAMQIHGESYTISLLFFGFSCLTIGFLLYRSTFLPRALGILMTIAGVCYLVTCVAFLLHLGIASKLFPSLFVPIFIAELSLSLWLLVRGVRVEEFESVSELASAGL